MHGHFPKISMHGHFPKPELKFLKNRSKSPYELTLKSHNLHCTLGYFKIIFKRQTSPNNFIQNALK